MTDLTGKTLGDYLLRELIDDAGNSSVYQGVLTSTDRSVAVKVLKPEAAGEATVVQAFTQYAQIATRMSHPNLLPVLDSGQEGDITYLVTPYMENRSVAQQRSSFYDPGQASTLLTAVASGLEYIYNQGTIHGNLRSTNIILDADWKPLLSNYGIPFRQGETPTPYTSPEQIQGGSIDQRTDIYALGVILYELLSGRVPTTGTAFNLQAVRPDLPNSIDQVVQKATAQNPDQRYQTLGELLHAFVEAQGPVQEPAPTPAQPPAQPPAPAEKGTNWMGFILGAIVIIVLCLVVVVVGPSLIDAINPEADPAQPVAEQPIVEEPVVEPPTVAPPTIAPPEIEPPDRERETPERPSDGEGGGLEICGSLGLAGGIVVLPGIWAFRRRRRS